MEMDVRSGRVFLLFAAFAFCASLCLGQAKNSPTGTVTGHVYCADTNTPARIANVMLQPVKEVVKEPAKDSAKQATGDAASVKAPPPFTMQPESTTMTVTQTGLDGSFTLLKVKPGTYYLVVEKPGYVSPMAQFPPEEVGKPTQELADRLVKALRRVTVEANQTAQVEERIERGAAVSGTISFDDGSPAAGINLELLRKKKDGSWVNAVARPVNGIIPGSVTDDQGHYRMTGLPADEYLVQAIMNLADLKISRSENNESMWMGNGRSSLLFFSGGTVRKKEAVPFKVALGEERVGEDIVIPLSKLRRISGTLIAEHDGHVIDAASVSLLFSDDKTSLTTSSVGQEQPGFDFQFVPEGDYFLKVENARDATWETPPQTPGMLFTMPVEKATHFYGDKQQSITVHEDSSGLVVSVPEKPPSPGTATTGASVR